jgi:serine/threonine-protein kinase RsbW
MMRTGTIRLTIDSQLDQVFLVGQAVGTICAASPLETAKAREVEAAVVEAVNNAIEHAYGNEKGHAVEVVVTLQPHRIVFQICDAGRTMNQAPAILAAGSDRGTEDLKEGGRGFLIMRSFMDEVSYTQVGGRNVLTLVKVFEPAVTEAE